MPTPTRVSWSQSASSLCQLIKIAHLLLLKLRIVNHLQRYASSVKVSAPNMVQNAIGIVIQILGKSLRNRFI